MNMRLQLLLPMSSFFTLKVNTKVATKVVTEVIVPVSPQGVIQLVRAELITTLEVVAIIVVQVDAQHVAATVVDGAFPYIYYTGWHA
jgi:hypothetical protein